VQPVACFCLLVAPIPLSLVMLGPNVLLQSALSLGLEYPEFQCLNFSDPLRLHSLYRKENDPEGYIKGTLCLVKTVFRLCTGS
jgi:hypothetical protein